MPQKRQAAVLLCVLLMTRVRNFLTFFRPTSGGQTTQPILTQNGSIDVDSRKDDTFAVKSLLFIPPDLQGP